MQLGKRHRWQEKHPIGQPGDCHLALQLLLGWSLAQQNKSSALNAGHRIDLL